MMRTLQQWLFSISIFSAIVLQLVPWPHSIALLKPWFLGLVLAYFTLEQPGKVGLSKAFLIGLLADACNGLLFGEQAFRATVLVYVLLRFRYRLRFFPLWQQTAAIGAIFLNDCVLSVWVRMIGNYGWPPLGSWLSPVTAAALWPWLFLLFDRIRRYTRGSMFAN
jgi:rod shape-determining protein MreD